MYSVVVINGKVRTVHLTSILTLSVVFSGTILDAFITIISLA